MPIYETLNADSIDWNALIDADLVNVSEAYARLVGFVNDESTTRVAFKCDAATLNAFKVAACRIVGAETDKVTTFQTVKRVNSAGASVWKRLKRDETPRKGEEVREQTLRTFSGRVKRQAVASLRETRGVALKRQTLGDGLLIVALTRDLDDAGDDA